MLLPYYSLAASSMPSLFATPHSLSSCLIGRLLLYYKYPHNTYSLTTLHKSLYYLRHHTHTSSSHSTALMSLLLHIWSIPSTCHLLCSSPIFFLLVLSTYYMFSYLDSIYLTKVQDRPKHCSLILSIVNHSLIQYNETNGEWDDPSEIHWLWH